jgi:hypothetical protein
MRQAALHRTPAIQMNHTIRRNLLLIACHAAEGVSPSRGQA